MSSGFEDASVRFPVVAQSYLTICWSTSIPFIDIGSDDLLKDSKIIVPYPRDGGHAYSLTNLGFVVGLTARADASATRRHHKRSQGLIC
jgi:hypothetical protein